MKYITLNELGYDHNAYWNYVESMRVTMPPHIFQFASNPANHDLSSPNSLHDSWLEDLIISEEKTLLHAHRRNINIKIVFLGSRHDRYICIYYNKVISYSLQYIDTIINKSKKNKNHGDVLVHELIQLGPDSFRHELVFANDARYIIDFSEFEHEIKVFSK